MRRRLAVSALFVAMLLVGPLGAREQRAEAACDVNSDTCYSAFSTLNSDISTYVPEHLRTSMTAKVNVAAARWGFVPPNPIFPTDPIAPSLAVLGALATEVDALHGAGRLTSDAASILQTDIATLVNLYPTDPI